MGFEETVPSLLGPLDEPTFASLAEEAVRDYIDWNELTRRPLPRGMSAMDTWNLLTSVRRLGATYFPLKDTQGASYWYTITREIIGALQVIEHHCRSDSLLHRAILDREGHRYVVRSRIQEAIATCQLDGVDVPYEIAGRLLHEGRSPANDTERLVHNNYRLLQEIDDLSSLEFSPDLVRELHSRILHGVDTSALKRGPVRHNLTDTVDPQGTRDPDEAEEVLGSICDYANCRIGDPAEPVPLRAYGLLGTIGFWHLLPDFNGAVGRAVFRLFALKHDYPVLGFLPVSRMSVEWAAGRLEPGIVRFSETQRPPAGPVPELDYTPDLITFMQLVVAALDDLNDHIEETRRADQELIRILEDDEDLNYRQRSVLMRALECPAKEFRIRYHQTTHHVVYATARADLLELVERGYMRKEMRGKAFVFVPAADLGERIAMTRVA